MALLTALALALVPWAWADPAILREPLAAPGLTLTTEGLSAGWVWPDDRGLAVAWAWPADAAELAVGAGWRRLRPSGVGVRLHGAAGASWNLAAPWPGLILSPSMQGGRLEGDFVLTGGVALPAVVAVAGAADGPRVDVDVPVLAELRLGGRVGAWQVTGGTSVGAGLWWRGQPGQGQAAWERRLLGRLGLTVQRRPAQAGG